PRRLASGTDDERANKVGQCVSLRITPAQRSRVRVECDENAGGAVRHAPHYRDGSEEPALRDDGRRRDDIVLRAGAGQSRRDVCEAHMPEQEAISGAPRGQSISVPDVEHSARDRWCPESALASRDTPHLCAVTGAQRNERVVCVVRRIAWLREIVAEGGINGAIAHSHRAEDAV